MLNKKYQKYLSGKSVALVGPAEYLSKLNNGEYIDSFDVVVRVNRGTEVINKYCNSIGKRTDILYNCLIKSPDNGGEIKVSEYKRNKIKWIATIPDSDRYGITNSNKLHKMVNWFTVLKLKWNFNFHIMDYRKYLEINKVIESRANTGFAAIFDLLNHGVSNLYITGFSFYLDSFINGYKKGCGRNEKEFAIECFDSKRHKQHFQWRYLKETLYQDKRINVDPILRKILNLDNLTRDNNIFNEN